tara:strand:+ start:3309 stop:3731 length:423 start_codon:yes stop_codon:yes gene_type:complete
MTMSLVGPYLTTTSYKKPKAKQRTKAQQIAFEQQHREYNKSMKRMGCHDQMMTLENYTLYCRGQYKPKLKGIYVAPETKTYFRETKYYPSVGDGLGIAAKKESQKYTGTLIKGIATMHKSNAVPVLNKEQAIEISNMRRS